MSEFECGRATYINSLGQGTNIQLPLSPECAVYVYSKYLRQVSTASTARVKYIIVTPDSDFYYSSV